VRNRTRTAGAVAIEPFSDEHLDAAASLLAARHTRHRRAEPLLPARFEAPEAARPEIEGLWTSDGASGTVAIRDGSVVGYLLGIRKDDSWGANVWVETGGHAVEEAETARDLYAAAAERWVDEGRTRHYALVPVSDIDLVEAWFRLSFGQQHAHAIREVPPMRWPSDARPAEPGDIDALVELAPLINLHQRLSPVFGMSQKFDAGEIRAEIETEIASGEIGNVVGEAGGRVVGSFVIVPVELSGMHSGLARPEHACYLGFAVVAPDARGSGAGPALTEAAFAWAHEKGYSTMVTDWRVTNLLASRFWPRRGFRPTFVRLYRSIP
jgi:ribosomal protein S18 acetylase RimI-like enzyme